MLFSYQQVGEAEGLPEHTRRFAQAALDVTAPQGLVLGAQAFHSFLDSYGVGSEVGSLIEAITDEASVERVEYEIQRRIVTGRIPDDVADAITEAREILSMDEKLNVSDIPLVAVLSTDHPIGSMPVMLNVVGKKAIADAIRTLWSRLFKYPYPNGIPSASIILYRMPPADSTVEVRVGSSLEVEAVQGWGRFVQASETTDVFSLSLDGTLESKDIRSQEKMVHRNPRTGEIVQTRPTSPDAQSITDDLARTLGLQAKRVGVASAIFGIGEKKHWLLSVGDAYLSSPEPVVEPVVEEAPAEPAVQIVEIHEEPEPVVEVVEPEEEREFDDPMSGPADSRPSGPKNSIEETMRIAESLLESVHSTIDARLREWLHGDQPDSFADLVNKIAAKRQLPYKNRLLTLDEMKRQGAFTSPSPEAVRFGLETLTRFSNEF